VQAVLYLTAAGLTDREVSHAIGVPINTIRAWRNHGISRRVAKALGAQPGCATCGDEAHDFAALPRATYAYLLGVYLGDGCLGRQGGSWAMRVYLDAAYPEIIRACCEAIHEIRGRRRPTPIPHQTQQCVLIQSYWRSWPCLFPQHGPGRKHERRIQLADWQQEIVDGAPGDFLRGLIHTDGWRGVNRVYVKGKHYESRYQFSNRSDDIRKLFTDTCEKLAVEWRQWTRYHISVARRESVAILDSVVGPKY
jgi:hypothetical protein